MKACDACGGPVADLHRGTRCYRCEEAEADRELEKSTAVAEAAMAKERRRGVEVAGMKLMPVDHLPGRTNGAKRICRYNEVIQGFIASGIDVAKIEGHGLKNAASAYAALREALGNEKRCYPVTRQGACYLVRVKK